MKNLLVIFSALTVFGCSSHRMVTAWKVEHMLPSAYNKVMVVGVFKDSNDSLRRKLEDQFVKSLENQNYRAVPASTEFEPQRLVGLGEAETFLKLCHNGVDAVITVALIDGDKETYQRPGYQYIRPASYYYNRAWSYQNIQADITGIKDINDVKPCFWEIVVYDLNRLEAVCAIQTKAYLNIKDEKMLEELARKAIQRIIQEKALEKKKNRPSAPRAF